MPEPEEQFIMWLCLLSGLLATGYGVYHTAADGLGCHSFLIIAGAALVNSAAIIFLRGLRELGRQADREQKE